MCTIVIGVLGLALIAVYLVTMQQPCMPEGTPAPPGAVVQGGPFARLIVTHDEDLFWQPRTGLLRHIGASHDDNRTILLPVRLVGFVLPSGGPTPVSPNGKWIYLTSASRTTSAGSAVLNVASGRFCLVRLRGNFAGWAPDSESWVECRSVAGVCTITVHSIDAQLPLRFVQYEFRQRKDVAVKLIGVSHAGTVEIITWTLHQPTNVVRDSLPLPLSHATGTVHSITIPNSRSVVDVAMCQDDDSVALCLMVKQTSLLNGVISARDAPDEHYEIWNCRHGRSLPDYVGVVFGTAPPNEMAYSDRRIFYRTGTNVIALVPARSHGDVRGCF